MINYRALTTFVLTLSSFYMSAGSVLARSRRLVEIRWDFTEASAQKHLEIWTDCVHGTDLMSCTNSTKVKKFVTPSAESFELKASDKVTLVGVFPQGENNSVDIQYTVTGTNLDDKDLSSLKKLFGATAEQTAAKTSAANKALAEKPAEKDAQAKAVTDALIAGGKLHVVFDFHTKDDDGKDKLVTSSAGIDFMVAAETPRLTVSYGLGFSTAASPSVAINKTSTVVSFTKDGKIEQAYQQVVALKDSDASFKPIQSLVTLANFRLLGPVYGSVGVPVNNKIFESPILGGTYRVGVAKVGLNVTVGVQFSNETEILAASGFAAGQVLDPTLGTTADDVPTHKVWHRRFAMGFSVDF